MLTIGFGRDKHVPFMPLCLKEGQEIHVGYLKIFLFNQDELEDALTLSVIQRRSFDASYQSPFIPRFFTDVARDRKTEFRAFTSGLYKVEKKKKTRKH